MCVCVCVRRGGSSVCVMTWWNGQRKRMGKKGNGSEREIKKKKHGREREW